MTELMSGSFLQPHQRGLENSNTTQMHHSPVSKLRRRSSNFARRFLRKSKSQNLAQVDDNPIAIQQQAEPVVDTELKTQERRSAPATIATTDSASSTSVPSIKGVEENNATIPQIIISPCPTIPLPKLEMNWRSAQQVRSSWVEIQAIIINQTQVPGFENLFVKPKHSLTVPKK